jgi:hypothetical protein
LTHNSLVKPNSAAKLRQFKSPVSLTFQLAFELWVLAWKTLDQQVLAGKSLGQQILLVNLTCQLAFEL